MAALEFIHGASGGALFDGTGDPRVTAGTISVLLMDSK